MQKQLARYEQLYLQYRNWGAFDDPTVQQRLTITPDQQQRMLKFNQEWNTQMAELESAFRNDPVNATRRFNEMQSQFQTRVNSVLTQQQQQGWRQLTGEAFPFAPSFYFPSPPSTTGK